MDDDELPPDATPTPEMDRRASSDRRQEDRRKADVPVETDRRAGAERRAGPRRKRQGPNQYELDAAELEFINAINAFKAHSGQPFPTWSEVLGILRRLGYEKSSE